MGPALHGEPGRRKSDNNEPNMRAAQSNVPDVRLRAKLSDRQGRDTPKVTKFAPYPTDDLR